MLLALIDLREQDFPRRELLDTLHSPYVTPPDLTPDQIAQLERISLARQVVRGRATWLAAIAESARAGRDEEGEDIPVLETAEAETLTRAVQRHFERLAPPPTGTAHDFTRWIADLIGPDPDAAAHDAAEGENTGAESGKSVSQSVPPGAEHFNLLGGVRAGTDAERVARDMVALCEFRNTLSGIRAAHNLVAGDGAPRVLAWADFRAELELAVGRAEVVPVGGLSRLGRVLATDVLEARGLPHDHVFILGMSEGVFPQPEPEDPLYTAGERDSLESSGIEVQTAAERADDLSLFYQIIGLARRSLTLSRFTVDRQGTPCPPSPYWTAVRALVDVPDGRIERAAVGAAPRLDDAATLHEAALAVAAVFSGEQAADGAITAESVHNALLDHAGWGMRWRNVLRGRAVEARREDPGSPFDRFSGLLAGPDLIAEAARVLGPDRVWSASQLNDLGACPFRFFARRLLQLEELKEPEEGLDALQRGLLNHAILERTYRRIAEEELSIVPEHQARALAILAEAAADVFADAPTEFGFRPSPVWEHEAAEMLRRLAALVRTDFSESNPFRPVTGRESRPVAERVQGLERRPLWLEARYGDESNVTVDGPAGPLRVRGVIDRMDAAGGWVVVVDYKTGTTPHPVDEMRLGRDYQMLLYLLAAQTLLPPSEPPLNVAGGLFWHIGNRAVSGEVLDGDPALDDARAQLHAQVLAARAGQFPVLARKLDRGQCTTYCEFKTLCRTSRAYHHKAASED
jgi:RecB family exonuclease